MAKRSGGTDGTEYFNATPVLHTETGIADAASTAKQVTIPERATPRSQSLLAHGEDSLSRRRGLAPIPDRLGATLSDDGTTARQMPLVTAPLALRILHTFVSEPPYMNNMPVLLC